MMSSVWRTAGVCVALVVAASGGARAQTVRSLVNGGNDLYHNQKFADAEVRYRKALEQERQLVQGHFNLGDALHQQGKYDEAIRQYQEALNDARQDPTRAHAYYNIGNSLLKEQKYEDAIKSYIESLKIDPGDEETKYNLSYALQKIREQQQQPQNKNPKQDQKKKQQNPDQPKQQEQQPQNQQQQQKKMSRSEAERILAVLKNSEQDLQKKLHARQPVRAKTDKDW